ncbi:hypothetical protein Tco_1489182, partial [Tanacetum coccineum]
EEEYLDVDETLVDTVHEEVQSHISLNAFSGTFTADVMLLLLGGCDMALGIQWLSTLGDIKWNFQDLKMEFLYNNRRVCLRGTNKTITHWLDAMKQIEKMKSMG